MAFIIISASIGWTISTIGIWMTKRTSPWSRILSVFLTVLAAIFLAACIDWIFAIDLSRLPRIVLFFVVAGVAVSVLMAKANYKYTLEPDLAVTLRRSELLLVFAGSATFLVILRELTGL